MPTPLRELPKLSAKPGTPAFLADAPAHFRWMHAHAPVCRTKIAVINAVLVAGYEDCKALLEDDRFTRDRRKTGARTKSPLPMPRTVRILNNNMVTEDDPEHRRLRSLVAKVFTPKAIATLGERVEGLCAELLDDFPRDQPFDFIEAYSLPIPTTVIREMMGVPAEDMPKIQAGLRGLQRMTELIPMLTMLFVHMPRTVRILDAMIEAKRGEPEDDLLSALIRVEEAGDKLNHEELLSLAYTIIVAGYETTVHLIANAVLTLLQHPEQLAEIRADLDGPLLDAAVEEVLRVRGPIQTTKPVFPKQDLVFAGAELPRGTLIMPCLATANRDPAVFEDPDRFDIHRPKRRHLSFGGGPHFCLGAALARLETKVALRALLRRFEHIELAVPESQLVLQGMPLWHRYDALPLRVR
ncbi:CypA [Plesiocystis pacifica SIR-1]|uniref:CypA n=1 Tax=Plesiocystis pacifica SIR-1 TaxID=391625 RepID=A6G1J5_9BACT|nr:cytochrome P450 [Plesiocystis pacifica]EDM80259.1 CypA [Plesiocystis pacifica SIR-1]